MCFPTTVRVATVRVAAVLTAVALVVTPGAAGPLTDKGTQPGLSNTLLGPGDCGGCHADYDSTHNIEPNNTWAGSMMAQASRDPLFWAALDVANNDIPDVGDFCLRCHVPTGWLAGRSEPPGGSTDGCSFEGKLDERDKDFEGVSCHLCHRMQVNPNPPPGEDAVYFENGQFWLDDSDCGGQGEPCRRGPYDYPSDPTAPHAWAFSSYHVDSDICGNCHNVTSPAHNLIENGTDTGVPFPIERTFMEWQQSDFAPGGPDFQTCQNCHMPDATSNPAYASSDQLYNRSGNLPTHQFAGGNSWIPDVIRGEYPNLNLDNELIATRDWALDMLQNQSATVETTVPAQVAAGGTLDAQIKVTNLTGHKLPTGYPEGRRMWLNVQARDGLDNLIWESGAYDPSTGVLTEDAQIKIYHAEPGIWNHNGTNECDIVDGTGNAMFHFVLNDCWHVDNRLPPKGFTGGNHLETKPVGYTYPETSPGSGVLVHYDVTDYAIPIPQGTTGPVTVTATLRFQTVSKDYVDFLLRQSDTHAFPNDCIERSSGFPTQTRAEILHDMWSRHGRSAPVAMDSASGQTTLAAVTPGEASAPVAPMLVTGHDPVTGDVTVSYDPACASTDHTVYYGDLASVSTVSFSGQACALGTLGSATFNPGTGNVFWVIVANDGTVEGSYGTDSTGVERPEDTTLATCPLAQDLSGRCD